MYSARSFFSAHSGYATKYLNSYLCLFIIIFVMKHGCSFPRKGFAIETKIALVVKTLIKSIKKTAIKDFIKALQNLKLMFEDDWVSLIIVLWNLNDNRFLFQLPKSIKHTVRNHHHIGFILFLFVLTLLLTKLMHIF